MRELYILLLVCIVLITYYTLWEVKEYDTVKTYSPFSGSYNDYSIDPDEKSQLVILPDLDDADTKLQVENKDTNVNTTAFSLQSNSNIISSNPTELIENAEDIMLATERRPREPKKWRLIARPDIKYCIMHNFTVANVPVDPNSISLCTHASLRYAKFVFDHMKYWDDHISVAFVIESTSFESLWKYEHLLRCYQNSTVTTHVVWESRTGNCSTDPLLQALEFYDTMKADQIPPCTRSILEKNYTTMDNYPANILRNTARNGSLSEFQVIADIENHFSTGAVSVLRQFTNIIKSKRTAVIVRRFESETGDVPRNISTLAAKLKEGTAFHFHKVWYARGHAVACENEFITYSLNLCLPPMLQNIQYTKPVWEPQLMLHKTHPLHFEMMPMMHRDQACLPHELCRAGVEFAAATHVFSCHDGVKRTMTAFDQKQKLKNNAQHRRASRLFQTYLDTKYPKTNTTCGRW